MQICAFVQKLYEENDTFVKYTVHPELNKCFSV